MKNLKTWSFFLLTLAVLVLSACREDEECMAPALSSNVVGEWELLGDEVEFRSDGALIDEGDVLISVGTDTNAKSWSARGDTLTLDASGSSGAASVDLAVVENECDAIAFELFGFNIQMRRKED